MRMQYNTQQKRMPLPEYGRSIQNMVDHASFPRLDFSQCTNLTFEQPDTTRFRNLALAYEALHRAGNMPCIVNAANEVVVSAFLHDKVSFLGMSDIIEKTMNRVAFLQKPDYDDYVMTDSEARRVALELVEQQYL